MVDAGDASRRRIPDIYSFEHARPFIRAWKELDRRRSFEWMGDVHRLGGSKSTMHGLCNERAAGKQLPILPTYLEPFIRLIGLEGAEAHYFRLLVRADEDPIEADRVRAAQEIGRIQRARGARSGPSHNIHLLEWYYFAIINLLRLRGSSSDPVWIARHLRPQLSPAEVQRALNHLLDAGALEESSPGEYRPTSEDITFAPEQAPEIYSAAMRSWHRWFVQRAPATLSEFPPDERDFRALVVNVPRARYAEAVALLKEAQEKLLFLCEEGGDGEERVYLLSTQFFPVTAPIVPAR